MSEKNWSIRERQFTSSFGDNRGLPSRPGGILKLKSNFDNHNPPPPTVAFVDESGTFHCPGGHSHSRGPINGVDVYRCLSCGKTFKVSGVAELR
ncbi:MAG: hypothetical protein QM754_18620 [Tepidisphaeraceae bacterium]